MSGAADPFRSLPTAYAGVTYRSRLEARWARFFDVAGIRCEYEPEGADLGPLGGYYPDFRAQGGDGAPWWVEVKGDPTKLTSEYLSKLRALASISNRIVLVGPVPDPRWFGGREPMFAAVTEDGSIHHATMRWEGLGLYSLWGAYSLLHSPSVDWAPPCPRITHDALDAARNERFGLFPQKRRGRR